MKKSLLSLFTLCSLTWQAFGHGPLHDPFLYAPGTPLIGQTPQPGYTWVGAGPAPGQQAVIDAGSLQYPCMEYANTNRVSIQAGTGPSAVLPFSTPDDPLDNYAAVRDGVVYFSFALRVTDLTGLGDAGYYIAGLSPIEQPATTTPIQIYARVLLRTAPGGYQVGLVKSSNLAADFQWDPRIFAPNDTLFLVGMYFFLSGPDKAYLWVNPDATNFCAAVPPDPTLTSTKGPDVTQLASFVFLQRAAPELPAVMLVDELHVGREWLDVVAPGCDWDDLPDAPYRTLKANHGPSHQICPGIYLGYGVSSECDGQPDPEAMLDDGDNGVACLADLVVGAAETIFVNASCPGKLDAYFDWNGDSDLQDADEHLYGISIALNAGLNPIVVNVPSNAKVGTTYARFRFSTMGNAGPGNYVANGEVEGYRFDVLASPLQTPDLVIVPGGPTGPVVHGGMLAYSVTVTNRGNGSGTAALLTVPVPEGLTFAWATASQGVCSNSPSGVQCQLGTLPPGATATVSVSATFDFDALNVPDLVETVSLSNVVTVTTTETDAAPADNAVAIVVEGLPLREFGDAPAPPYNTCLPSGARHRVQATYHMGPLIDAEADCQSDDNAYGLADEDGVTFMPALPWLPGTWVTPTVTVMRPPAMMAVLDAWLDADGVPGFHPADRIYFAQPMPVIGPNVLPPFQVPPGAPFGDTWMRFRLSQAGVPGPGGFGGKGEVEDYPVRLKPNIDLELVVVGDAAIQIHEDEPYTLTLRVSNQGSNTASGVQLATTLPDHVTAQSATTSHGTCQVAGGNVTCQLTNLAPGQENSVAIAIMAVTDDLSDDEFATLSDLRSVVTSSETDLNPANNQVAIPVVVVVARDWGDARDGYPVTSWENGARHKKSFHPVLRLGATCDSEINGTHSNEDYDDLNGLAPDDEDGVNFTSTTGILTVEVTVTGNGFLNAWMDFNRNLSWGDAGEQIVTDDNLTTGTKTYHVRVPAGVAAGELVSRWRFSQNGGLSYIGYGGIGEVEDYSIDWQPALLDFGDAPETLPGPPPIITGFPVTLFRNGARHEESPLRLGNEWDAEPDGQPSGCACRDDNNPLLAVDDEDGVVLPVGGFVAGTAVNIEVWVVGYPAMLDAWVDWNGNLTWDDPAERIATALPVNPGLNLVLVNVPMGIPTGDRYARFRLSTMSTAAAPLPQNGKAWDGEVEDYKVYVQGDLGPNDNPHFFGGLWHTTLGDATVSVNSNGLQFANLDGPKDAVRIDLGQAEGWSAKLEQGEASNGALNIALLGHLSGQSNQPLASLHMARDGSNVTFSADFSGMGAGQYVAEYYDPSGALLSTTGPRSAGEIITLVSCVTESGARGTWVCEIRVIADSIYLLICDCVRLPGLSEDIPGDILIKFSAVEPSVRPDSIDTVEFRGSYGTGVVTLRDEALYQSGRWHRSLGAANLSGRPGDPTAKLELANIGSSGQDGLVTELVSRMDALEVFPESMDLGATGRQLRIAPLGVIGDSVGPLGSVELVGGDTQCQLVLDHPLAGVWQVVAWNGSERPAPAVPVASGVAATLAPEGGGSVRLTYYGVFQDAQNRLVVELELAEPLLVTPTGCTPIWANEIRCTTDTSLGDLRAVQQTWSGLTSLILSWFFRDYGDAPDGYPVTKIENGASHRYATNWKLGDHRDFEFDGHHSANADYDDTHGVFGLPWGTDDEDGVEFVSTLGTISVRVTAATDGHLDAWMDFNRNSDWGDLGEQIVNTEPLTAGVAKMLYITVPAGTSAGQFVSRWRFSESGGLSYTGYGGKGEVEDHLIDWQPETAPPMDYGDLPNSYLTTLAVDGARHLVLPQLHLGTTVDTESDGVPTTTAEGDDNAKPLGFDDEDGVSIPVLVPGIMSNILVYATLWSGVPAYLDAWIDWNRDGAFDEVGEKIFNSVPLVDGLNTLGCAVPTTAILGTNYARFRLSLTGGLSSFGYAASGEVEDYLVNIIAPRAAADLAVSVDTVPAELQEGDSLTIPITVSNLGPDTDTSVQLSFSIPTGAVLLSVTNDHGSSTVQGSNVTCRVTSLAPQESFIVQAVLGIDPQVAGQSGPESFEVSMAVSVVAAQPDPIATNNQALVAVVFWPKLDFGDARFPLPVTRAENGARHRNGAVFHMGLLFDREFNGVHSPLADHDDLTGLADEDGVLIPSPLLAGRAHTVTVTVPVAGKLDAFFDWSNNGDWADPGECVTPPGGLPIGPGAILVPVTVPLGAVTGSPHARFRFSEVGGLSPTNFHYLGEVEDYQVEIRRVDFGSAPDPLYPTLLASDGARHIVNPAWHLGLLLDWEADGPDSADGDGVVFATPLAPGTPAAVQVTASIAGWLDGFIDFNGNGVWEIPAERITLAAGTPVVPGVNIVNFTVPAGAALGNTWARFRFSNAGGLGPTGPADIGEVEDYAVAIVPPPLPVVVFGGLPHAALGNATVSVNSNGLQVANLGTSSQDGVRIDLGRSEGWRALVSQPSDGTGDGFQTLAAVGQLGGQSNQPLASLRVESQGSNLVVAADFSALGASQYTASFYNTSGARLLVTSPLATGQRFSLFLDCPAGYGKFCEWHAAKGTNNGFQLGFLICECLRLPDDTTLPDPPYLCVLTPVAPVLAPDYLSAVEVRGTVGSLTLSAEALRQFGLWHQTLDGAVLHDFPDDPVPQLHVANLGASREGGLETFVGGIEYIGELPAGNLLRHRVLQAWPDDWVMPWLRPSGGSVRWTVTGRAAGSPNAFETLSDLSAFRQEQGTALSVHFDALGVTQVKVDVFNGPNHVGAVTLPVGTLGTVNNMRIVKLGFDDQGSSWLICYDKDVCFTPAVGAPLTGDRLRIAAVNLQNTIEGLRSLITRADGVESLTLRNISTAQPQAPRMHAPRRYPGGGLELTFPTEPDVAYDIERSPTLLPGSWTPVGTVMGTAETNTPSIMDNSTGSSGYYRIRVR